MILAGLTAGAIAAVIAALVSLPLHSPVDSAFNTATVTVAALVVGLIAGLLWMWLSDRVLWYAVALAGLFVAVLVIALAGNTQLDRLASFTIPLAAIVIAGCAVLTPLLAMFFLRPALGLLKWSPAVAAVVALALGFGLITQGDAESGELALPPPPTATAPTPAATSAPENPTAPPSATVVPTAVAPTAAPAGATASTQEPTSATPDPAARPAVTPTPTPVPAQPTPEPSPTAAETRPTQADGETQSFIIGEGSKVTFTVEEELGRSPVRFDAVIAGAGLSGTARLDGQPSVVTLDLHSLSSDQQYRDRYIQSRMFPDTPEAIVTVDELPGLPQSFFDGEEATGQLNGSLQIGETVTPLVFDVTARKDGDIINILGLTTFTWEQLGLAKPTARSVVYLADEVRVQVLLIAAAP